MGCSPGLIPTVVSQGSIDADKTQLRAVLTSTDQSVQACGALPDADRASWGAFYTAAMTFAQSSTGFWVGKADADQACLYQQQVADWQTKLAGEGCRLTTPQFNPNPPPADYSQYFKWAAVIVGSVAAASVVAKVVEAVELFKAPAKAEPVKAAGEMRRRRKAA